MLLAICGFDILGLGHKLWPVRKTIAITPQGSAIGCFDTTFGEALPPLRRLLQSGKFPVVRVHLWWSDAHVIAPLEVVRDRAPLYEKLAKDFPNVKVYLSHSCEYNEPVPSKVESRIHLVRTLAPSCIPVNSCWKGHTMPGVIAEHHGSKVVAKEGEIVSTDGESIYDINADKWVKDNHKASLIFLWGLRYNLRQVPDPGQEVPPPKLRTAAPSPEYLKAIVRLSRPEGNPPATSFNATPIKKPLLYKTFAEDAQGAVDKRANRPVLILPLKVSDVTLMTFDQQIIGSMKYGGTFTPGLWRYYSGSPGSIGLYGAEIGEKAKRKSGSEYVWIKAGNKIYGPCHPAFRTGYFR